MNGAWVCGIIGRTIFNVRICLNHCWRYKHNQIERPDEKPRHQKKKKLYSYCTRNYNFYYFLETRICFVTKKKYLLRFVYLFFPKIGKNDCKKAFIKKLVDRIWYALSSSTHNIPSHFCDLILAWCDCYKFYLKYR